MNILFIDIVFLVFTLFILGKLIFYGIYEIKTEKNLFGGICVITFSLAATIFSNIMIWIG